MAAISRQTIGKAFVVTCISAGLSVLIAASVVPILGGSYDGIGMWLSFVCPIVIAFPASSWQFHQSDMLRKARDELSSLHVELNRMHAELLLAHNALKQKARLDAMTGALTREAFLNELNAASAAGGKGTLLLADADHFKRINDSFGHQTGDEALVAIAAAIRETTGIDDFCGRIGGEEFAIFLAGSGATEGLAVAESLRRRAEATDIRREKGRVPITISIGGVAVEGHSTYARPSRMPTGGSIGQNASAAIASSSTRLLKTTPPRPDQSRRSWKKLFSKSAASLSPMPG